MFTAGGAIGGYCAIGRAMIARIPAMMMTMAITTAKIGRSMKKRDTLWLLPGRHGGLWAAGWPERGMDRGGRGGHHLHRRAWLGRLQAFDDQAVTGRQAGRHQPLIAHGP